jgi:hypothetical protein
VFTLSLDEVPSMKDSMCGLVVFAALTGLWSCNGDPTEGFRDGERIIADPTTVFVDQGTSKFVTVQVVDSQGNQLSADFQPQNVGAGITVEEDPTYLQTTNGGRLQTSARFEVTGLAPASTSFEVVAGGATGTIPVRVVPTSFAATVSNPTPAPNEPVTITLPSGFKFAAGAGVSTDQGAGIVQSFSTDSTALVAVLPVGSTGPVTLDSVQVSFLPGVTLGGIPTDATVTIAATPAAGTGSTATAPDLPVPALGATTGFFDVGTFTAADVTVDGGVGAQYYRLVITEAGDYTITTNWPATSTADIDAIQCPSSGCAGASTFVGSGLTHPEQGLLTLTPGTYFLAVVLFAGAAPPNFSVQIDAVPTPPPPAP